MGEKKLFVNREIDQLKNLKEQIESAIYVQEFWSDEQLWDSFGVTRKESFENNCAIASIKLAAMAGASAMRRVQG